jgi:hypothetical protein
MEHSVRILRERLVPMILLAACVLAAGSAGSVWAQRSCTPTQANCPDQDVTSSTIQMGGAGSLSSNGSSFSDPGRLDDGTIAEADLVFTYDRTTGVLTLQALNQTTGTASLTGLSFNTPASVTGMTLVSHTGSLPWELAYDNDRDDGVVDTHPSLTLLKMDGMGAFNVLLANKGIDTGAGGGDAAEILAGQSVTYTIQVSGDIANVSACSFTSLPSRIVPGDKIAIAVARFQAGNQGGSGFLSPCDPGDLLVTLASFSVVPDDGRVSIRWATSSETGNAGFAVLRREPRSGKIVRLNPSLLPGDGSEFSGAAYVFDDPTAVNGVKYHYMLEDFDLNGMNTIHPPERAVPNPVSPPIRLIEPAYEARAGNLIVMRWESDARMPVHVRVSNDPLFPGDGTVVLSGGAGRVKRLSPRDRVKVREMAADGEGGVYWQLTGRSPRGQIVRSQTYFLVVEP